MWQKIVILRFASQNKIQNEGKNVGTGPGRREVGSKRLEAHVRSPSTYHSAPTLAALVCNFVLPNVLG